MNYNTTHHSGLWSLERPEDIRQALVPAWDALDNNELGLEPGDHVRRAGCYLARLSFRAGQVPNPEAGLLTFGNVRDAVGVEELNNPRIDTAPDDHVRIMNAVDAYLEGNYTPKA
jgi:hypothetical protein